MPLLAAWERSAEAQRISARDCLHSAQLLPFETL
jgi:hypothetical protein